MTNCYGRRKSNDLITSGTARKLAEWIGAGRQLTSNEVLNPALAIEACRVLGIELPPGRLADASPRNTLQRWLNAASAELGLPDVRAPAA
jgi:hypothetical protein